MSSFFMDIDRCRRTASCRCRRNAPAVEGGCLSQERKSAALMTGGRPDPAPSGQPAGPRRSHRQGGRRPAGPDAQPVQQQLQRHNAGLHQLGVEHGKAHSRPTIPLRLPRRPPDFSSALWGAWSVAMQSMVPSSRPSSRASRSAGQRRDSCGNGRRPGDPRRRAPGSEDRSRR